MKTNSYPCKAPSRNALMHAVMPAGHWATNTAKKVREFFVVFARQSNFDPLVATNWYHIKRQAFYPIKVSLHFNSFSRFLIFFSYFVWRSFIDLELTFIFFKIGSEVVYSFLQAQLRKGFDGSISRDWTRGEKVPFATKYVWTHINILLPNLLTFN